MDASDPTLLSSFEYVELKEALEGVLSGLKLSVNLKSVPIEVESISLNRRLPSDILPAYQISLSKFLDGYRLVIISIELIELMSSLKPFGFPPLISQLMSFFRVHPAQLPFFGQELHSSQT